MSGGYYMAKKLNLGIIGLGARGSGLLEQVILPLTESKVNIIAVCDIYKDRAENAANKAEEKTTQRPTVTNCYKEILAMPEVDAVLISAAWEAHVDIAIAAMKAGKYVGLEVGGAYTIEDCWKLVDTYEETGSELMFLENCCYGKRELMALNIVRKGLFGDVVHCAGGYMHDLREEIVNGKENRHYRLRNYIHRNCENYPTHELGPIAKLLNINNGNRMMSLTSTASCSKGLHEYVVEHRGESDPLAKINFNQGDVITTVIRCVHGQTITLTLDTTLPRAYSRGFTVRGTKGSYFECNDSIYFENEHREFEWSDKPIWGNAEKYEKEHQHPLWKNYIPQGGHDGMDWMVFNAFFDAALEGRHAPIDAYDAAAYMCITALSEHSIMLGGAPVDIPDFTRGKWYRRDDIEEWKYSLDKTDIYKDIYLY